MYFRPNLHLPSVREGLEHFQRRSSSHILTLLQGARGLPRAQREEEPLSDARIEIETPNFRSDLGNELYFVKLPKFLSIEPK